MKKSFHKISSFLLILITITILFSSCNKTEIAYNKEIKTADSLFTLKQFDEAKKYYVKALNIKKGEKYPTEQIAKIDIEVTNIKEKNYKSLITKADELFTNKQYKKAKELYLEASDIKPTDDYLKTRVNEINQLTTKQNNNNKKPYHIIVGSYAIKANAIAHQKRLKKKKIQSIIKVSSEGNNLVSIKSFKTITQAYNYLDFLENRNDENYNTAIWIYQFKK